MIDKIKRALEKEKIDYWKIANITNDKREVYFQLDEQECFISGQREDIFVTVYKKFKDKIGEATVSITNEKEINKKIREAIISASLVKNPFYVPFGKFKGRYQKQRAKLPSYEEIKKKALEAYNAIKGKKERINALEILNSKSRVVLLNSFGCVLEREKGNCYVEVVITSKGKRGEQEYVAMRSESDLSMINFKELIDKYSIIARDISNAVNPKFFKGPVLLSEDAIAEFFVPSLNENPLVVHTGAKMKYLKISRFEKGKKIVPEIIGDKITIISNPLIKKGLRTFSFDDAFIPAKKVALIENGIMKNFFATKRYADYLKIEPTGPLGNIEVKAGKIAEKEMRKDGVCEIVGFSSFAPNVYSGDFTAEIRLGYFYKNGKKIPFKGGMFVGNCIDIMKNIRLSKETFFKSGYYGPKALMVIGGVVTGF
ncbi:MAG: metallopeptidase TldD-related protein [Candidatus Woesearchaeota archaeon]